MEHDHRYVVHDEGYVSEEGVHTNQVECLWSLLQPWLEKFRGLSKQRLEQATRTYGFLRSLNLTGAPIHGLIDCVAANVSAKLPNEERLSKSDPLVISVGEPSRLRADMYLGPRAAKYSFGFG